MFRDVIALRTRVLGPTHPDTAISLSNLGHILGLQQRWEEAVEVLRESVKAWREGPGRGQALSANALGNLGAILRRFNKLEESEELFRESLAVQQTTLSEGDPAIAMTKSLLGDTLTALSRYEDAEPLLLESWERLQSSPPAMRQRAAERLLRLYEAWGKPEEAARWREATE
jgi:tetratricopeptide (TPR) repeat protein